MINPSLGAGDDGVRLKRKHRRGHHMQFECEPNLNKMAQRVQNLFMFKHLYDQMDFNPEQKVGHNQVLHRAHRSIK